MTDHADPSPSAVEPGVIDEFRYLREEIATAQQARLLILGFVFTAIGTIFGIVVGQGAEGGAAKESVSAVAVALLYFALLLLFAAIVTTTSYTRKIEDHAAYIRTFIEPIVPGLNWETRWGLYRSRHRSVLPTGLPLGMSKLIATFYVTLLLGVLGTGLAARVYTTWWAVGLPILTVVDAVALGDLYIRFLPGWHSADWDVIRETEVGG